MNFKLIDGGLLKANMTVTQSVVSGQKGSVATTEVTTDVSGQATSAKVTLQTPVVSPSVGVSFGNGTYTANVGLSVSGRSLQLGAGVDVNGYIVANFQFSATDAVSPTTANKMTGAGTIRINGAAVATAALSVLLPESNILKVLKYLPNPF